MTKVLGDYHLIKPIGQGALGLVYLAEHRFMKRQYALKILSEDFASDRGFIQRFEDEIAVLAMLDHPNIVKIHDISFAQGQYFLVSDCVVDTLGESTHLGQYVASRQDGLKEDEIFDILLQIAKALDYAHGQQRGNQFIVHRGLKLNNILISSDKIQVSDFGLSRIVGTGVVLSRMYRSLAKALELCHVIDGKQEVENEPPEAKKLSKLHDSFLQSYVFLAPEQKRFEDSLKVDSKADVYAFGVLAYYLLASAFPEGAFEKPSALRPNFKRNWDQLIFSCLSWRAGKRPLFLVDALEETKEMQVVSFAKDSTKTSELQEEPGPLQVPEERELAMVQSTQKDAFVQVQPESSDNSKSDTVNTAPQSLLAHETEPKSPPVKAPTLASADVKERQAVKELKPVLQTREIERPSYDPDPARAFHVNSNVKHYQPEPKEVKNVEPILTDMVVVKGGQFHRGSDEGNRDEMPRHKVSLASFAIDIHPVTNEQFLRFLEAMGGEKDSNNHDIIRLRESRLKRSGGKLSIESGYSKHPVVGLTWYGAIAYAKWVGKRLPTEAEWEVAACSAANHGYPYGEDIEKSQANFFSSDTTAVMSYAPNELGLYDMAGNVYEWCQDWYGYNYYEVSLQEPDQPKGPLQGVYRVLRGGCWKSLKEDLRCSHRHRNNPGTVNRTYGFRCVANVEE